MSREITVAYAEPRLFAQFFHRVQAMKSIAAHSPTAFAAQQVRQHINNRIDVRRNINTPPNVVVTGIHDDGEFFGGDDTSQSVYKPHSACPARPRYHHAGL